jgi:Mrp family chromosome partitioning ATPase
MTVRAKQMIQKVGGNLVGLVLNNINMSQDENYYYYSGYYYNYYNSYGTYSRPEDEPSEKREGSAAANGQQQPKEPGKTPSRSSIKPKF